MRQRGKALQEEFEGEKKRTKTKITIFNFLQVAFTQNNKETGQRKPH